MSNATRPSNEPVASRATGDHLGRAARRVPTQARSRRRVEEMLDAAAALVRHIGVAEVTTRGIADAAGVPVATLYQYFADKEAVMLALADRDMAEMDEQVASTLAGLSEPTLAELVEATMRTFVSVFHRRPAFVEIYLRGRGNVAVRDYGRQHNRRIAEALHAYATDAGLVPPTLGPEVARVAVELGDRAFEVAFTDDIAGDPVLLEEGIAAVTAYLESRAGVPDA